MPKDANFIDRTEPEPGVFRELFLSPTLLVVVRETESGEKYLRPARNVMARYVDANGVRVRPTEKLKTQYDDKAPLYRKARPGDETELLCKAVSLLKDFIPVQYVPILPPEVAPF